MILRSTAIGATPGTTSPVLGLALAVSIDAIRDSFGRDQPLVSAFEGIVTLPLTVTYVLLGWWPALVIGLVAGAAFGAVAHIALVELQAHHPWALVLAGALASATLAATLLATVIPQAFGISSYTSGFLLAAGLAGGVLVYLVLPYIRPFSQRPDRT